MGRLAAAAGDEPPDHHGRMTSQLVFALLCELSGADSVAPALPPLVTAAIEDIRQNYAGLYGVEELSERLGVSKSHLVRTFTAAVGVPPGRYLTTVRIEAAMRLLLHREYTLDVIASLCGFSGANYLCRVFKKRPANPPRSGGQWPVRQCVPSSPAENQREQEPLYLIKFYALAVRLPLEQVERQRKGDGLRRREGRPDAGHPEQGAQHQRTDHDGRHAAAERGDGSFRRAWSTAPR